MDNNEAGIEANNSQNENQVFPKYVNYYLAIMAVSCYECEYLLCILQEQFILNEGPIEWLVHGLQAIDPKIERIAPFNEVLAYKPWTINKSHFEFLMKEGGEQNLNWSIHEVLKASIILSTYHGLCSFCMGMGLIPDSDVMKDMQSLIGHVSVSKTLST
jgi:hypothetical protein